MNLFFSLNDNLRHSTAYWKSDNIKKGVFLKFFEYPFISRAYNSEYRRNYWPKERFCHLKISSTVRRFNTFNLVFCLKRISVIEKVDHNYYTPSSYRNKASKWWMPRSSFFVKSTQLQRTFLVPMRKAVTLCLISQKSHDLTFLSMWIQAFFLVTSKDQQPMLWDQPITFFILHIGMRGFSPRILGKGITIRVYGSDS